MKQRILQVLVAMVACTCAHAQVNSGSNGSDGVFNPTVDTVVNMADHPDGIYQYTSVNIPSGVTVTFIPNANNTPVVWLVQNGVVITGNVDVSGQDRSGAQGGLGGPAGYKGGNGLSGVSSATPGQGPGGGPINTGGTYSYGNTFLIPLLGGSGGGGAASYAFGGGGGGGAILIAASSSMLVNGAIHADAGGGGATATGSGGAIRLVASQIFGNGSISCGVGSGGRVRFDTYDNEFSGFVSAQFTSGFQPIIIPAPGQLPQLTITSVGGVPVSPSPTGVLSTPDAVLAAQQNNPIPIVVNCVNLPLHSLITVNVKPMTGSPVTGTAYNDTGTLASSTAAVSINIPRGGGLLYATAATSN